LVQVVLVAQEATSSTGKGTDGSNSVFSTITSTGGGGGGNAFQLQVILVVLVVVQEWRWWQHQEAVVQALLIKVLLVEGFCQHKQFTRWRWRWCRCGWKWRR
jgi:hypothetical protein